MQSYAEDFEDETKDDQVMLGGAQLRALRAGERLSTRQPLTEAEAVQEEQRRFAAASRREQQVKEALQREAQAIRARLAEQHRTARQLHRAEQHRLQLAFRQAEERLLSLLRRRQAEIEAYYGDLVISQGYFGGARSRRWRLDWHHAPQPVQLRLGALRGPRDRLPAGRYVLTASLYDRLGGYRLRWSQLRAQEWRGATLPVTHEGSFTDLDLNFDQSVFAVCPPQHSAPPGLALVLELYRLRRGDDALDSPVAWGALPLRRPDGTLVTGKHKVPLVRGAVDRGIALYAELEHLVRTDLQTWVGNMYLDLTRLSRYVDGQREFEVELEYTSGLLGHPDRFLDDPDQAPARAVPAGLYDNLGGDDEQAATRRQLPLGVNARLRDRASPHRGSDASLRDADTPEPPDMELVPVGGTESSERVRLEAGVAYRMTPGTQSAYYAQTFKMVPKVKQLKAKPQSLDDRLAEFSPSVVPPPAAGTLPASPTVYARACFALRLLACELGLGQPRTPVFALTLLFLLAMFWLRMWAHYLGQYVYVESLDLPVTEFYLRAATAELNYQPSFMLTREVVGVVCLGPLFVLLLFLLLVATSAITQLLLVGCLGCQRWRW